MTSSTTTVGQYLFRRVTQLGVGHVFGLPGDFNLTLLDELFKLDEPRWLGASNELNAAYAADGYTRIRGVPGVLVTTYGVGELSAMNGVAGAYAEHAGMIHIVGMPSRLVQKMRAMIHHTLEPGMDQTAFVGMSAPIRKTHTVLDDEATAAQEIDRVIQEGARSRLPVFIYVPMDIAGAVISAERLATPLSTAIENKDLAAEDKVVAMTLELLKKSSNPAILADALTAKHGAKELVQRLVDLTQFPTYSTSLSKGAVDETHPCYRGLYNGQVSFPGVAEGIEKSDLILDIAPLLSDSNTGGFTRNIVDSQLVSLGHAFCQIRDEKFDGVHFLPVLKRIVQELEKNPAGYNLPRTQSLAPLQQPVLSDSVSGPITQAFLWQRIGRFLKPNDIVLAESGTAQFGMPDSFFPAKIDYITQQFWSSIGYSVGACLGVCVAAKELKRDGRVILLVGEGSLQLTVQEIGTIIRFGYTPTIFVINNNGYSIERAINGPQQTYNNIGMLWDHQKMLEFFGARPETGIASKSVACKTIEELEAVLNDDAFNSSECIQLCEVFMDAFDYPWRLSTQVQLTRARMEKAEAAAQKMRQAESLAVESKI